MVTPFPLAFLINPANGGLPAVISFGTAARFSVLVDGLVKVIRAVPVIWLGPFLGKNQGPSRIWFMAIVLSAL